MSELIDRLKTIEILTSMMQDCFPEAEEELDAVITTVREIPSAELERKKGEWIYDGMRGRFPACKCSICEHYENADWALLQGANFCPNCGADMRDEDERTTN